MIVINIDVMLAKRKMKVSDLADQVGITLANMSVLKNGKAKAIRVNCQPGDILEWQDDENEQEM